MPDQAHYNEHCDICEETTLWVMQIDIEDFTTAHMCLPCGQTKTKVV